MSLSPALFQNTTSLVGSIRRCYAYRPSRRHVNASVATTQSITSAPESQLNQYASSSPSPLLKTDASLRTWVEEYGGSIFSSLRLTENAPCGCRGVITTAPIPLEVAHDTPLILVPEKLYMTTEDACQLLRPLSARRFALSFWHNELPGPVQLAVLLAAERLRGDDSFWAPYIRSLPDAPPCAWALGKRELQDALAALGPGAQGWEAAVTRARSGVQQRAELAVQRYGKHVAGDLCTEDVVWALGQVLSRSFGRDPDIAMAPYVDLCNHRHGAPRPAGILDERDGLLYVAITSSSFGMPRSMAAGEEVYVSYAADGGDPLAAFLNLGFVPPELLPPPVAGE